MYMEDIQKRVQIYIYIKIIKNDDETFTLNNPTREGFTFVGWTGSNGSTPQLTVTIQKGTTGDLEFVANWIPN